jgi:formylmethanofuran dehydrogenase subunit A
MILQTDDESVLRKINVMLSQNWKVLDAGRRLIPKGHLKKLHELNAAYERWEVETKTWEEVKDYLDSKYKRWITA